MVERPVEMTGEALGRAAGRVRFLTFRTPRWDRSRSDLEVILLIVYSPHNAALQSSAAFATSSLGSDPPLGASSASGRARGMRASKSMALLPSSGHTDVAGADRWAAGTDEWRDVRDLRSTKPRQDRSHLHEVSLHTSETIGVLLGEHPGLCVPGGQPGTLDPVTTALL
jgi:hypothetical protein